MADSSAYAALLPDEPRWVDTRGILLCWPATVLEGEGHRPELPALVVVSGAEPIAAVVGRPGRAAIARAVERLAGAAAGAPEGSAVDVLCQPEDAEAVAEALSSLGAGWTADGATLHRLPGDAIAPDAPDADPGCEIALVPPETRERVDPGAVPGNIYQELDLTWRRGRPVAVAFVDGRPAAFLSAALETEGWWDVSVETLAEHRRRGLAAGCFRVLHGFYRGLGKRAVWGAHDSNPASLRLAARLGFVADSRLAIFGSPL